ncbi:MAG: hypothetical protein M1829_003418 [Trizodia sp. TS-e1964]|nr:MAG: hypothetical protein M1829_003418 [Trizodia sp. TS-e1964]
MRLRQHAVSPSLLLIGALVQGVAQAQICYYPDGTVPTDYAYEPCSSDAISSCCIPSEGDVCLSNGLCQYGASSTYYFRGACTDKNWTQGGGCVSYCPSTNAGGWEKLVRCSDTQYCCLHSTSGTNCCDTPSLIFKVQFPASIIQTYGSTTTKEPSTKASTGTSTASASASTGSTPTSKSSSVTGSSTGPAATFASSSSKPLAQSQGTSTDTGSSSAASSTASAESSSSKTLPIALGAGVGGGIVVGALAIGLIFWCCIRKKHAQTASTTTPPIAATYSALPPQPQPQQWGSPLPSPGPMEMGGREVKKKDLYPQMAPAPHGNAAEMGGAEMQKSYFGHQNVYEAPA